MALRLLSDMFPLVPGEIKMFAGNSVPTGWFLCDGSAVSRTQYKGLFGIIGTTYGAGNGSTTFNLPDLRGRSPMGDGAGPGLSNRIVGQGGGEERHTLGGSEIGAHSHYARSVGGAGSINAGGNNSDGVTTGQQPLTQGAGGNGSHNNMQPYSVIRFIISH